MANYPPVSLEDQWDNPMLIPKLLPFSSVFLYFMQPCSSSKEYELYAHQELRERSCKYYCLISMKCCYCRCYLFVLYFIVKSLDLQLLVNTISTSLRNSPTSVCKQQRLGVQNTKNSPLENRGNPDTLYSSHRLSLQ